MKNGFSKLFAWGNFLKILEFFGGVYLVLDVIFKYNLLERLSEFQRGMIAGSLFLFLFLIILKSLDQKFEIVIIGDKK